MSRPLIRAVPAEGGNKPVRIELKRKYSRIIWDILWNEKYFFTYTVPTALDLSLCDFSRTKLRWPLIKAKINPHKLRGAERQYAGNVAEFRNFVKFRSRPSTTSSQIADWKFVSIGSRPQTCCLAVWPLMLWENKRKFQIRFDLLEFLGRIEVRASRAVYILKSKFGCRFAESNLSYCHVNVAGDGQPLDSLVSLCSHFGIANKHREMF